MEKYPSASGFFIAFHNKTDRRTNAHHRTDRKNNIINWTEPEFIIRCLSPDGNGKCDIEMTRIRYWYDEARDGGENTAQRNGL